MFNSMNTPITPNTMFDDNIGSETENTEYKEFTFNCSGIPIDIKLAEKYCKSNKFEFNKYVDSNLKKYADIYAPKYGCAFWNAQKEGKLFFGINDSGFVKGIPYAAKFQYKMLKNYILKNIHTRVRVSNGKINLTDFIKIKITKIKSPPKPETEINEDYLIFLKQKEEILIKQKQFMIEIEDWRKKMSFYTQKLIDLTNDKKIRNIIINYISNIDPTNISIDILKDDTYILQQITHDEISELKKCSDNPYYWITQWKDEMVTQCQKERPIFNCDTSSINTPINIISSASKMIPHWCNYNDNVNLYIITINYKKIPNNDLIFEYYDVQTKKWISCIRTIFMDEPACVPLTSLS
jgi:hypothetical protein